MIYWPVAALSYLLSFGILMFAREEHKKIKHSMRSAFQTLGKQASDSVRYSFRHHVLFYFFAASAVGSFAMALNVAISWIPFLKELGLQDHAFGYMWSAMATIGVISSVASQKLLKRGKERMFIVLSTLVAAFFALLAVFAKDLAFAFAIFFIAYFFLMVQNPATRVYFHRFIPSKLRATIGSVEGMLGSIVGIISLPIAGFLLDHIGPRYTIFISGLLMIPAAIIFYRIKEKKQ